MPPQSRGKRAPLGSQSISLSNVQSQDQLVAFPDPPGSYRRSPQDSLPTPVRSQDDASDNDDASSVERDLQSHSSSASGSDGSGGHVNEVDDEERDSYGLSPDEPSTMPSRSPEPTSHKFDGVAPSSKPHSRSGDSPTPILRPPLLSSRSQSSLSSNHHPSRSAFLAPPFYNRPPTPLPPSPSLSSLLRPPTSQSAFNSHPTTPDSSDTEFTSGVPTASATTSTTAAITSSALAAPSSFTRTSPRVPTHEYYGFVLYITSSLAFLMYLLWSYLPSTFLHFLGITYYPDRWWSLAIPGWLVMLVGYIYVALACYNTGYLTLDVGDVRCLVDEAGMIATVDETGKILGRGKSTRNNRQRRKTRDTENYTSEKLDLEVTPKKSLTPVTKHKEMDWHAIWSIGTDGVMDIPVGGVCEVLYGTAEG